MKKISILSLHLGYGGIEKCVVNLANVLCKRYQVEIAVSYQLYEKSVFPLDSKVKVVYLNKNLKPNHDAIRKALKTKNIWKIIKEGIYSLKVLYYRRKTMINYISHCDSDVIISTRDIFNYWVSGFAKEGVLKIGWEHNHFHGDLKYANKIYNSAKKLDYLVLVSSDLQKYYEKRLRHTSCMCLMIPNAIDKLPSTLSPLKEKRFVSVGRLSKEKGFMDLLMLYKEVLKLYPDWRLDIVGDGPEKEILEKYIIDNSLDQMVKLHGFQGKEYIDSLLAKSSIYLMTSYTESFGIVLIEAMSHGIPCIAYDSAEGAREIIMSGENGYLIKNRNMEAMKRKISDLIDTYEKRKEMGKKARESVQKYTNDVVGEEWFTLIEESGIYE